MTANNRAENVKLTKTEIRTLIATIYLRAAYSNGGSYSRDMLPLFIKLQKLLGENFDMENSVWFKKGEPNKVLKWGLYCV